MSTNALQQFTITRQQESDLYKLLKRQCVDDAFRYEMIARKFMRVADGYGSEHDEEITADWLRSLRGIQKQSNVAVIPKKSSEAAFKELSDGIVGNPLYQAYLDTLEQHELDAITHNAGYMAWNMDMTAAYLKHIESNHVQDRIEHVAFAFEYAHKSLSNRIRALAC